MEKEYCSQMIMKWIMLRRKENNKESLRNKEKMRKREYYSVYFK
jgi:hypothetical protein